MDDAVRKVLSRACTRFKTGIRKPFRLGDFWARIEPERWDADDVDDPVRSGYAVLVLQRDALVAHNVQIGLTDVTAEAVHEAYLQAIVTIVHAL
jgi:hypothetical protein